MRKLTLISVAVLFAALIPVGSSVKLYNHKINVDINENNVGEVKETFRLGLDSSNYLRKYDEYETEIFKELSSETSENISKWTEFHKGLKTSIVNGVENLSVSTSVKQKTHNVILTYKAPEAVELVEEKGRIKKYELNTSVFRFYKENTGLIIPDNTNLWIDLYDSLSEESVEISPDPINKFAGHEFHWNTGTWNIKVKYQKTDPISSWTLQGTIESFRKTFISNPVYGVMLLILIGLAFIYRNQIKLLFSEGLASEQKAEKPKRKV